MKKLALQSNYYPKEISTIVFVHCLCWKSVGLFGMNVTHSFEWCFMEWSLEVVKLCSYMVCSLGIDCRRTTRWVQFSGHNVAGPDRPNSLPSPSTLIIPGFSPHSPYQSSAWFTSLLFARCHHLSSCIVIRPMPTTFSTALARRLPPSPSRPHPLCSLSDDSSCRERWASREAVRLPPSASRHIMNLWSRHPLAAILAL